LDQFSSLGHQKDSIFVQFLDLASQQGRLFFVWQPADALRAVEQHRWLPMWNYQIAQQTDAQNGVTAEGCKKTSTV
jgi:hypothetical protein